MLHYTIILFKIRLLRRYNFKMFERCDPKNRRHKHRLDIKGNIKGNWEPHKSQHLQVLFLSNTYSSFTQFIDWKYTGKLDEIFSRDFEIWILILLKIYITQKNKMAEFKMADIIGKK